MLSELNLDLHIMAYEMLMSLIYEYYENLKKRNGKFTYGGHNVLLSMDGGMELYQYIEQSIV